MISFLENGAYLGGLSLEEGRNSKAGGVHVEYIVPRPETSLCSTAACKPVCGVAGEQSAGVTARIKPGLGPDAKSLT